MKGRILEQYERAFADRFDVKRAFAFWKGRVAAYAVLKAMGVKTGDEVIIPGYTCVMAVNPIVYLGARPVFVDIDPVTYNLIPEYLEAKITPRTKVLIAQHTYGYPAEIQAVMDIAHRKGLPVLEDCCLALGSECHGRLLGTFGTAAYFSFQWNKPYTSGLGGMAITSDAGLASRIEAIQREALAPRRREVMMLRLQLGLYRTLIRPRSTAFAQALFRKLAKIGLVLGSSGSGEYTPLMAEDFCQAMNTMQARSGLRQLRRLDENIAHRRRMTEIYDKLLAERGWPVTQLPPVMSPVLVRYPVRVADKAKALATAAKHLVELGSWFECPLHPIETRLEDYEYRRGMCPQAEKASLEVVNLPLHPRANERTARRSVEFVDRIGPSRQT